MKYTRTLITVMLCLLATAAAAQDADKTAQPAREADKLPTIAVGVEDGQPSRNEVTVLPDTKMISWGGQQTEASLRPRSFSPLLLFFFATAEPTIRYANKPYAPFEAALSLWKAFCRLIAAPDHRHRRR